MVKDNSTFTERPVMPMPVISSSDRLYCAIMGPTLLVCSVFLGILNLPVTYCHRQRKPSLETSLFVILAIADLVTTYPFGCIEAVQLIRVYSNQTLIEGTVSLVFVTSISLIGCFSQSIATYLSLMRTMKIKNPFVAVNRRIIILAIFITNAVFAVSQAITFTYFIIRPETADLHWLNDRISVSTRVAFYVTFVMAIIGNSSSFFGVIYLHFHNKTRRDSFAQYDSSGVASVDQRVEITLLLLNIPYMIQLVSSLAYLNNLTVFKPIFDYRRELHYLSGPILTSCFNPVILLCRSDVYQQHTKRIARKIACYYCITPPPANSR